jgi:hypothetical protein
MSKAEDLAEHERHRFSYMREDELLTRLGRIRHENKLLAFREEARRRGMNRLENAARIRLHDIFPGKYGLNELIARTSVGRIPEMIDREQIQQRNIAMHDIETEAVRLAGDVPSRGYYAGGMASEEVRDVLRREAGIPILRQSSTSTRWEPVTMSAPPEYVSITTTHPPPEQRAPALQKYDPSSKEEPHIKWRFDERLGYCFHCSLCRVVFRYFKADTAGTPEEFSRRCKEMEEVYWIAHLKIAHEIIRGEIKKVEENRGRVIRFRKR